MLVPTAPVAARAVLPDDPGVALALATDLLGSDRLMANHHRGLWGYSGSGAGGAEPLSIQSTGVGAGSAALVLAELIELGVTSAVRIGTCRVTSLDLDLGSTVAASSASAPSGNWALDPLLVERLGTLADTTSDVASIGPHDTPGPSGVWDLETAALAEVAARAGIRLGALLVVSGSAAGALGHEEIATAATAAGRAAASALGD